MTSNGRILYFWNEPFVQFMIVTKRDVMDSLTGLKIELSASHIGVMTASSVNLVMLWSKIGQWVTIKTQLPANPRCGIGNMAGRANAGHVSWRSIGVMTTFSDPRQANGSLRRRFEPIKNENYRISSG
jgi:hypothetical protein